MKAPAKVNLCLRVLGRREDGYHSLWTIFDALEFGDELDYEPGKAGAPRLALSYYDESGSPLEVGSGLALPPEEDNLVLRAARAFADATGLDASGLFSLRKCIPSGAGLGGGSSDAATAVLLLCERHAISPATPAILDLAEALGADVPFFLQRGRAWADGRGDRIHPVQEGPQLHYLLLFPGFPCPTAEVFAHIARESRGGFTPVAADLSSEPDRSAFEVAAAQGRSQVDASLDASAARVFLEHLDKSCDAESWTIGFFNDLEPAAIEASPVLGKIREVLQEGGYPRFCLSGSGSTLFVASQEEDRVRDLHESLSKFLAGPALAGLAPETRLIRTRSLLPGGKQSGL